MTTASTQARAADDLRPLFFRQDGPTRALRAPDRSVELMPDREPATLAPRKASRIPTWPVWSSSERPVGEDDRRPAARC